MVGRYADERGYGGDTADESDYSIDLDAGLLSAFHPITASEIAKKLGNGYGTVMPHGSISRSVQTTFFRTLIWLKMRITFQFRFVSW